MTKSINSLAIQVKSNEFKLLPLSGKYYGTKLDSKHGELDVWLSDHYAIPFGSEREIANGWVPADGHDHVEDKNSLEVAQFLESAPDAIIKAVNLLHNIRYMMSREDQNSPVRMDYSSLISEVLTILDNPSDIIKSIKVI
jgi:hypothetical protein